MVTADQLIEAIAVVVGQLRDEERRCNEAWYFWEGDEETRQRYRSDQLQAGRLADVLAGILTGCGIDAPPVGPLETPWGER